MSTIVEIRTSLGVVQIDVDVDNAPLAAGWFLKLVESGIYDGTKLFRSGNLAGQPPKPRFLEGGPLSPFLLGERDSSAATVAQTGLPLLPEWETTEVSGLRHMRGSVSLARDITGNGEAAPDFFFALEDIPEMDFGGGFSPGNTGFPVIGKVASGMELVDRIAAQPRGGKTHIPFLDGQILSDPVVIERAVRAESGAVVR